MLGILAVCFFVKYILPKLWILVNYLIKIIALKDASLVPYFSVFTDFNHHALFLKKLFQNHLFQSLTNGITDQFA